MAYTSTGLRELIRSLADRNAFILEYSYMFSNLTCSKSLPLSV
jgi:hypothetical protein